jgi:enamine deaminase RidA (YjgF/YER057c/UK114 family)
MLSRKSKTTKSNTKIKIAMKPVAKKMVSKKLTAKKAPKVATPVKAAAKSTLKRINCGPRMSDAVVSGNIVYVSGKVATKTKGKSVTLQTKEILSTIDAILKQAGTDKTKIITANIWLSKISTFQEMNKVWDAWVAPGNTPARATVEAKLAAPDYNVEIMVTAAL